MMRSLEANPVPYLLGPRSYTGALLRRCSFRRKPCRCSCSYSCSKPSRSSNSIRSVKVSITKRMTICSPVVVAVALVWAELPAAANTVTGLGEEVTILDNPVVSGVFFQSSLSDLATFARKGKDFRALY